jgi:N utilization substance protein B
MNPQAIEDIISQFREEQEFANVDVGFFESLVKGVAREQETLDLKLAQNLDRPIEQLDVMERVILRIGAWELLHQPETPFQVILDEAIDLAKRFGAEQGHSYINGVLDKAARQWRPQDFQAGSPTG